MLAFGGHAKFLTGLQSRNTLRHKDVRRFSPNFHPHDLEKTHKRLYVIAPALRRSSGDGLPDVRSLAMASRLSTMAREMPGLRYTPAAGDCPERRRQVLHDAGLQHVSPGPGLEGPADEVVLEGQQDESLDS